MVKIFITGDFCPINRIEMLISEGNYTAIFNDLLSYTQQSDVTVTNLECPLTTAVDKIKKSGPSLKASESAIRALKFAGFNLVTMANNHIMDYGEAGLNSTLKSCQKHGIDYIGVGVNSQNARNITYKNINGIIIAFINFCENEWSVAKDNTPGANSLNPIANYYDIKEAKSKADHVFVIVHGGHEKYSLPSPRMKQTYRFFIDAGASAVIGHHTHCFSGYEIYNKAPIFYSLGNFIFDWENQNSQWNRGIGILFKMNLDSASFDVIPFSQCDQYPGARLLKDPEKILFKEEISKLNAMIADDKILEAEFDKFSKTRKKNYLSYLQPFSSNLLLSLYHRGIFPSFLSSQKRQNILNLITCESHRDVLLNLLMTK